jgi:hypothetical protein
VHELLETQAEFGWVALDPDGGFRATPRGLAFLADFWVAQDSALAELWAEADLVARLAETVGRVLEAAVAEAGAALLAMAPVHEPPGASPRVLLLNRLGTLRYHRADGHAAAWIAAGLTAAEIQAMSSGAERDAIEADTNARAAGPYTVLTADERLHLLADLAALPA